MAEENRFGARLLQQMLGNIEAYLACCQLGITMASLGLGWVGEPTVAGAAQPVLIPLGMPEPALHFTVVPGRLPGVLLAAHRHRRAGAEDAGDPRARAGIAMDRLSAPRHPSSVFYPLNWLLNSASRSILRMLGVRESSQQEILTDVEIEGLVEVSAEHGKMEMGQAEYIHNVFRFGELQVSDVMVHRTEMVTVNADDPPANVVETVLASPATRVPLWRELEDVPGAQVRDKTHRLTYQGWPLYYYKKDVVAGRSPKAKLSERFGKPGDGATAQHRHHSRRHFALRGRRERPRLVHLCGGH